MRLYKLLITVTFLPCFYAMASDRFNAGSDKKQPRVEVLDDSNDDSSDKPRASDSRKQTPASSGVRFNFSVNFSDGRDRKAWQSEWLDERNPQEVALIIWQNIQYHMNHTVRVIYFTVTTPWAAFCGDIIRKSKQLKITYAINDVVFDTPQDGKALSLRARIAFEKEKYPSETSVLKFYSFLESCLATQQRDVEEKKNSWFEWRPWSPSSPTTDTNTGTKSGFSFAEEPKTLPKDMSEKGTSLRPKESDKRGTSNAQSSDENKSRWFTTKKITSLGAIIVIASVIAYLKWDESKKTKKTVPTQKK